MAQNLKEYLETNEAKGFRPVPHYFAQGDFVTYYLRNDRCYAQRLDDMVTIFLAFDSDVLVGCKIKGVKHILQTAGDFGVTLDDGAVQLGLFFFTGATMAKDEMQKKRYAELARMTKDVTLDRRELQPAELG
jgi:hypothetical protein